MTGQSFSPQAHRPRTRLVSVLGYAIVVFFASAVGTAVTHPQISDSPLRFLAGLAVVGGLVVAIVRPTAGYALLLVLLPFRLSADVFGTSVTLVDVLVVSLAVLNLPRVRLRAVPPTLLLAGALVVGGSLLAAAVSREPIPALWGAGRWVSVFVLLFAACSLFPANTATARRAVALLAVGGALSAIGAILQSRGIYILTGPPYLSNRIDSTFGYYTQFAGFMAVVALLAAGEVMTFPHRRVWHAPAYGLVVVLACLGIALSLSRGGALALGAGLAVLVAVQVRREGVLRAFAVLGAMIILLFLAVPKSLSGPLADRLVTPGGSVNGDAVRSRLHSEGSQVFLRHPLGLGYGNFPAYQAVHPGAQVTPIRFFHVHSTPLQVGLDAGWLGLAGFLVLIGAPLLSVVRDATRRGVTPRRAAAAGALVGLAAQGGFDYLLYEIQFVLLPVFLAWAAAVKDDG